MIDLPAKVIRDWKAAQQNFEHIALNFPNSEQLFNHGTFVSSPGALIAGYVPVTVDGVERRMAVIA